MNTTAIDQVKAAKARYCRFLDTKQWRNFFELFVLDARVRVFDTGGIEVAAFSSSNAFMASARHFLADGRSIHQIHNDELVHVSDREISATWSMEDYIIFPSASPGALSSIHGYGHYHETWIDDGDGWRIATLELHRTILESTYAGDVR
jgi:hypothetical protein